MGSSHFNTPRLSKPSNSKCVHLKPRGKTRRERDRSRNVVRSRRFNDGRFLSGSADRPRTHTACVCVCQCGSFVCVECASVSVSHTLCDTSIPSQSCLDSAWACPQISKRCLHAREHTRAHKPRVVVFGSLLKKEKKSKSKRTDLNIHC